MSSLLRCALVALVLAGCATTSGADYTGRTEVRGRLVLHSNPSFSFQLADDWRMATAADWPRFGPNARVLGRLNDYGKQQFNQAGAVEMKRYPFVLISMNGAWVNSGIGRNQG